MRRVKNYLPRDMLKAPDHDLLLKNRLTAETQGRSFALGAMVARLNKLADYQA